MQLSFLHLPDLNKPGKTRSSASANCKEVLVTICYSRKTRTWRSAPRGGGAPATVRLNVNKERSPAAREPINFLSHDEKVAAVHLFGLAKDPLREK